MITYEWRGPFTNAEVNALHAEGFGHRCADDDWQAQLDRHSLGWVCAREYGGLAGFVNVAWDGGSHAFILDTLVAVRLQRRGVGTRLVAFAVAHARAAGCEWLHVDFEDHLRRSTSAVVDSGHPTLGLSACDNAAHDGSNGTARAIRFCRAECALASGVAQASEQAPQDRASLRTMALRPDEFYDHALAAADGERRLPLARMTGWDISPFEPDGLRVAPLRPPVLPEPARHGEDPGDCDACRARDEGIWLDDRWRLTRIADVGVPLALMLHPRDHYDLADLSDELAAELGLLMTHIVRHIQALPNISRAHVYRIGDGGAHLHIWFFARPEGQAQLYGSWMVIWDDLLPEYPEDVAEADAAIVSAALVASYGGRRSATSEPRT